MVLPLNLFHLQSVIYLTQRFHQPQTVWPCSRSCLAAKCIILVHAERPARLRALGNSPVDAAVLGVANHHSFNWVQGSMHDESKEETLAASVHTAALRERLEESTMSTDACTGEAGVVLPVEAQAIKFNIIWRNFHTSTTASAAEWNLITRWEFAGISDAAIETACAHTGLTALALGTFNYLAASVDNKWPAKTFLEIYHSTAALRPLRRLVSALVLEAEGIVTPVRKGEVFTKDLRRVHLFRRHSVLHLQQIKHQKNVSSNDVAIV